MTSTPRSRWALGMDAGKPTRVSVVIPARNEEALIGQALRSVRESLDAAGHVTGRIIVVADACTDRTIQIAEGLADAVLQGTGHGPGAARALGMDHALASAGGGWLMTTDADSTTPAGWVAEHLRHAALGADAVAGRITVNDWDSRPPEIIAHHEKFYAMDPKPVHATNLSFSPAAYLAVGGFLAVPSGEDRDLVARLEAAGRDIHWCRRARVATSARRSSRAAGGFAAHLNELEGTLTT